MVRKKQLAGINTFLRRAPTVVERSNSFELVQRERKRPVSRQRKAYIFFYLSATKFDAGKDKNGVFVFKFE